MKKGISFYFGYPIPPEKRAKMIKDAGFDCIMTSSDNRFDHQNGTLEDQVKLFEENSLELSSLHSKYSSDELYAFFEDGTLGDKLEASLIEDVYLAQKYGFTCVVSHMYGHPSKIGFDRIRRILKVCEETNIPLAIENINCQEVFLAIFENISHPLLKFCYDCGHNNVFDKDFDYLSKFGDKLICLHLHDNMGENDDHTVKKFGSINWDSLAQKLAKINPNMNLDFELLFYKRNNMDENEAIKEAISDAKWLEEKIAFYSKK